MSYEPGDNEPFRLPAVPSGTKAPRAREINAPDRKVQMIEGRDRTTGTRVCRETTHASLNRMTDFSESGNRLVRSGYTIRKVLPFRDRTIFYQKFSSFAPDGD